MERASKPRSLLHALASLTALLAFGATSDVSTADTRTFGPFQVASAGDVIRLDGEIDGGSALDFRRALAAAPGAKLLTLDSPGGSVAMALLIADDVYQHHLATLIPPEARCYSACAYIFLAGLERSDQGKLGVHQLSSDEPDLKSAQLAISDIIDVLNRFHTPADVLTIMFRTPPDDIHVFSKDEVQRFGINRAVGTQSPPQAAEQASGPAATDPAGTHGSQVLSSDPDASESEAEPQQPPAAASGSALPELSTIEQYTKRPNRVAMYVGLDFFGGDISSTRATELKECAVQCLASGQACHAFTFNGNDRRHGPNCFLKNGRSRPDGNSEAISGVLLRRADPDPAPLEVGSIDPRGGLLDNVDIPFLDLAKKPYNAARTAQGCRLACVANDRCEAFTFVKDKGECWLKSSAAGAQPREGMLSSQKERKTFAPVKIIQLDE